MVEIAGSRRRQRVGRLHGELGGRAPDPQGSGGGPAPGAIARSTGSVHELRQGMLPSVHHPHQRAS